jgi:hypothetical protein
VVNRGGFGNLIAPLAGMALSMAMGNVGGVVSGAISGGVSAIGDATMAHIPSATTIGSNGGLDSLKGKPTLQYEFKEVVDEDIEHRGKPLCQTKQIDTLSGYVKVSNAYINSSATQNEKNSIISYMEGGFYYE